MLWERAVYMRVWVGWVACSWWLLLARGEVEQGARCRGLRRHTIGGGKVREALMKLPFAFRKLRLPLRSTPTNAEAHCGKEARSKLGVLKPMGAVG